MIYTLMSGFTGNDIVYWDLLNGPFNVSILVVLEVVMESLSG